MLINSSAHSRDSRHGTISTTAVSDSEQMPTMVMVIDAATVSFTASPPPSVPKATAPRYAIERLNPFTMI